MDQCLSHLFAGSIHVPDGQDSQVGALLGELLQNLEVELYLGVEL